MMRHACWPVLTCFALLVGCADRRDTDYRLAQADAQRAEARQELREARARFAALEDRYEDQRRQNAADLAARSALAERVAELESRNHELAGLIEQLTAEPLDTPEVAPSPLPTEVDEALMALAARHAGRVWYDRGRAALSLANDRLFDPGSDIIRGDAGEFFSDLAGIVGLMPGENFELVIVGHTDRTPIASETTREVHPSNWHLSVHRAIAVQEMLAAAGVPPEAMAVMGYGPYRPVGDEPARNRRVEVFISRVEDVGPRPPVYPPADASD